MSGLTLRILLAEDNLVFQTIALRILRALGHQVDLVENGLDALAALRKQYYDVLLTDVQMPKMGGLEMTRRICQEWPLDQRPCIIAVTSEAMPDIREECLKAGMDECVSKPLEMNQLFEALKACSFSRKETQKA